MILVRSFAFFCMQPTARKSLCGLVWRKTALRETENNDYAKFGGDKEKALWYVMVFSGVVNCILCSKYINLQTGQPICTASLPYTKNPISIHLSPFSPSFLKAAPALYIVAEQGKGSDSPYF